MREETGLPVKIGEPFYCGEWRPVVRGEQWQIIGVYFKCETKSEDVKLSRDHDSYEWINPEDYKEYSLVEAAKSAFEAYLKNRVK